MSPFVAGRLEDLPLSVRERLGTFRHQVFVQRLRWLIPGVAPEAGSEWDEFDGNATIHLVALSSDGGICGCARLMPTTGPYLLRDVFPQLAGPAAPPSSPLIWEMSRFAGSGLLDPRTGRHSGMPLFPYALALALSFRATRVIGVVSHSVARLYRRFGLDLQDMSHCTSSGFADIVACAINLDASTFEKLRCDPASLLGSITFFGKGSRPQHVSVVNLHLAEPGHASSCWRNAGPFARDDTGSVRTHLPL